MEERSRGVVNPIVFNDNHHLVQYAYSSFNLKTKTMIIFLSVISAIVFIAISWLVGNYALGTFYSDLVDQFVSTLVGFMVIAVVLGGISLIGLGFYKLWTYLP